MSHTPRKRFGQNFLHDEDIIAKIIQALDPQASDNVLEIGPGLGALTAPLLCRLDDLIAIEIDRDLHQHLTQRLITQRPIAQNTLKLILADALTIDYSQFGCNLRVIGNLPYNISTPILFHLLTFTPFIKDMYFMLQKELVDRMSAGPGTKNYGRLSVMLQYLCEVEHLFDVPPTAFHPQPQVDSAVIRLTPIHPSPFGPVQLDALRTLTMHAFKTRRKTLANNLKGLLSLAQLADLGINGQKRPENISVQDYVRLTKFILQYK